MGYRTTDGTIQGASGKYMEVAGGSTSSGALSRSVDRQGGDTSKTFQVAMREISTL